MKKELLFWAIIMVLVISTLLSTQKAEKMSIDFTNTTDQQIQFLPLTYTRTGNTSICTTFELDTLAEQGGFLLEVDSTGNKGLFLSYYANDIVFSASYTTTQGIWKVLQANSGLVAGQKFDVCVTFTGLATPIIYVNGVSKTVTVSQAPVGTVDSYSSYAIIVGGKSLMSGIDLGSIDGRIHDIRLYNKILSADEALKYHESRGADKIRSSLVFCPMLYGAKGLQVFDGTTLAAGNTILDPCTGVSGTPANSPIARGETYLSIK